MPYGDGGLLIGDVFRNAARAVPARVAAAMGDTTLTFAEIDDGSNRVGRAVRALGVRHGDRVVVWATTSLDTIPLFAALAKTGAVFAPMNPSLSVDEALVTAGAARPALLVTDDERRGASTKVAAGLGVRSVTLAELAEAAAGEDGADLLAGELGERDPHVVFFTSGSTGMPKGVVLSHRVNYLRTHPGALIQPRGAMVCPFPLFHMAGWTMALQQWHGRDRIVFLESADAVSICDAVEWHRATRLYGIPAVWRRVLDHLDSPEGAGRDLSTLRFADTGTSATPPELLLALERAFPAATIRVFYGSTEAGGVATLEHADVHRKPGSCGVPALATETRIDEAGELWARGPLLFDGYFDDPEATAEVLVDGWYRTGDLAVADDDGYLTIVGRARDVIRTGGEGVAPAEVEEVLATHPAVADVAVIGLPDPEWGEVVCAVVVPADDGAGPTLPELRAHCEGRLVSPKHPRRLEVVDVIPRTSPTNQVQRRLLVERFS
ncbi:MAG TPA: AMP-binding protein [Acidimicrobiales bacterium]|nr:AMP-binding protein [Acidimicrobiales bacterium]